MSHPLFIPLTLPYSTSPFLKKPLMGLQTKKYKAQFAYTERKKLFKGNDSCFMSVVYHLSLSLCTHTQYRMIKKVMLPNANNFVSKNYHHLQ